MSPEIQNRCISLCVQQKHKTSRRAVGLCSGPVTSNSCLWVGIRRGASWFSAEMAFVRSKTCQTRTPTLHANFIQIKELDFQEGIKKMKWGKEITKRSIFRKKNETVVTSCLLKRVPGSHGFEYFWITENYPRHILSKYLNEYALKEKISGAFLPRFDCHVSLTE